MREERNEKIFLCFIELNLQGRTRSDIPESKIISNLKPGVVARISHLPLTEIASGAKARLYWGKGVLVSRLTLEANAEIPKETLPSERIMVA